MSKTHRYAFFAGVLGATAIAGACSSKSNDNSGGSTGAGQATDAASSARSSGARGSEGGAEGGGSDAAAYTYTLIDDMETTTHGPIELDAGITPPDTPGFWFNFGGTDVDGGDTMNPPNMDFTFTALPVPTTTLDGKVSKHAANQICSLYGQYDVCGFGFDFEEEPVTDGGAADASISDAGDGGEGGVPEVTVPFNISEYKGITFWAMASDIDAGGLDVKVIFPDTDTDPRGGVCNSAAAGASSPSDTSQCYNSYATSVTLTGEWQQFIVPFYTEGPDGGQVANLQIDTTFGYQFPNPWSGTNVYGIEWQVQDNNPPGSAAADFDFWIDDVYFYQ